MLNLSLNLGCRALSQHKRSPVATWIAGNLGFNPSRLRMSFSIRNARKTAQKRHVETNNLRKNWDSGGSTLSEVTC